MNFLVPRPAGAVPGRERHPQPAQHPDAARRPGPRPAHLVALPQRGDRDVRRRRRCRVRLAPLADLGHGQRRCASCREQRDLYGYLHDQTLRMLNQGLTGIEIAEDIELPPALDAAWHARGYYGSVSHNVKAIYQRYLGWFDGNPTSLWQHPPVAAATRYVDVIGGREAVAAPRRAATPTRRPAVRGRAAEARRVRRPGRRGGEGRAGGRLRAARLRRGERAPGATSTSRRRRAAARASRRRPSTWARAWRRALSVEQLFDTLAIRVDGPRAWDEKLVIDWVFTDVRQHGPAALSQRRADPDREPALRPTSTSR